VKDSGEKGKERIAFWDSVSNRGKGKMSWERVRNRMQEGFCANVKEFSSQVGKGENRIDSRIREWTDSGTNQMVALVRHLGLF